MATYSLGFSTTVTTTSIFSWEAYVRGSGTARVLEVEVGGYSVTWGIWVGTTKGVDPIEPEKLLPWDPSNTIPSMVLVCYRGWKTSPPFTGSGVNIFKTSLLGGGTGVITFPRGLLITSSTNIAGYNDSALTQPSTTIIVEE